jgi:DNA polymerase-3 subunit alpha
MVDTIPLFKSHYSVGKSILTLKDPEDMSQDGPMSIFQVCIDNDISRVVIVDDNMSGFLEAYTSAKKLGLDLIFGLRLNVNDDFEDKSADSLNKTSRYIIFPKNDAGFTRLVKIFSFAAKEGFYYTPRIDYDILSSLWEEQELSLVVPFYDSFIFNNVFMGKNCVPQIDFTNPRFFTEQNNLPFDSLIADKVNAYAKDKFETQNVKSIYYNNRKDFKSYLTFRCINNRSALDKPRLDHMCSDEFCFESWREQNGAV